MLGSLLSTVWWSFAFFVFKFVVYAHVLIYMGIGIAHAVLFWTNARRWQQAWNVNVWLYYGFDLWKWEMNAVHSELFVVWYLFIPLCCPRWFRHYLRDIQRSSKQLVRRQVARLARTVLQVPSQQQHQYGPNQLRDVMGRAAEANGTDTNEGEKDTLSRSAAAPTASASDYTDCPAFPSMRHCD